MLYFFDAHGGALCFFLEMVQGAGQLLDGGSLRRARSNSLKGTSKENSDSFAEKTNLDLYSPRRLIYSTSADEVFDRDRTLFKWRLCIQTVLPRRTALVKVSAQKSKENPSRMP